MKKTYMQPTMKVVEVQQRQMLCGSLDESFGINNEKIDEEKENIFSKCDGYNKDW